ncbi:MAG: YgfZ/GcvT domain-containing protein [Terriglobales bacterium]
MERTPFLYHKLAAAGARFGEFQGLETAAAFGDVTREFRALSSSCAVFDLAWRVHFEATGEDRVRWLNGMVTNNVRDLAPDRGAYAFLLNPQGRILGDLTIFNLGNSLLLETDVAQVEKLRQTFDKYIIMDDVELGPVAPRNAIGLAGPDSAIVLESCGLAAADLDLLQMREFPERKLTVVRGERRNVPLFEVLFDPSGAPSAWDALVAAGAVPVGFEALEKWRVAMGIPRYGQDIRERDLPQETEQSHALHFTKGCYVGQEIVERIRSRGQVHRKFTGFVLAGSAPTPGAKVQAGGKEVGEITSVATLPGANGSTATVALGYIRREAGAPGATVQVDGAEAAVADFPYLVVR